VALTVVDMAKHINMVGGPVWWGGLGPAVPINKWSNSWFWVWFVQAIEQWHPVKAIGQWLVSRLVTLVLPKQLLVIVPKKMRVGSSLMQDSVSDGSHIGTAKLQHLLFSRYIVFR